MNAQVQAVELALLLQQVNPTLDRLCGLLATQRRAVGDGDLQRFLVLTIEEEEETARLAQLEHRRQQLQVLLERNLQVQGLQEIGRRALPPGPEQDEFLLQVANLQRLVVKLHQENGRCAALLTAAIEMAQRTRTFLTRITGTEPAYVPHPVPVRSPRPVLTTQPGTSGR
jgi:hypothetical protein